MANQTSWLHEDGRALADVLRDRATAALRARADELLAPWRAEHDADPTLPPPPELSLALNGWWWTTITAKALHVELVTPEVDPLSRLGTADPRATDRVQWLRNTLAAVRVAALRDVARELIDSLTAGAVRITGVPEPVTELGSVRADVPVAVLLSRRWRLTADSDLIVLAAGTGAQVAAYGDSQLAVAPAQIHEAMTWMARRLTAETGVVPTADALAQALTRYGFAKREVLARHAELPVDLRRAPGDTPRTIAARRARRREGAQ